MEEKEERHNISVQSPIVCVGYIKAKHCIEQSVNSESNTTMLKNKLKKDSFTNRWIVGLSKCTFSKQAGRNEIHQVSSNSDCSWHTSVCVRRGLEEMKWNEWGRQTIERHDPVMTSEVRYSPWGSHSPFSFGMWRCWRPCHDTRIEWPILHCRHGKMLETLSRYPYIVTLPPLSAWEDAGDPVTISV